jgi:FkbM family methyltransferase
MLNLLIKLNKFIKFGGTKYLTKKVSLASYNILHQIHKNNIKLDTIIDVGANRGQFAFASKIFYKNAQLYSFEPTKSTFSDLNKTMNSITGFQSFNMALGNETKSIEFIEYEDSHINSVLKSFDSKVKDKYNVELTTLDALVENGTIKINGNTLLKMDVQGFELEVLKGSKNSLNKINYILSEVSFKKYYENQILYTDLDSYLINNGFKPIKVLDFLLDNGELSQLDVLYAKSS